MASEEHQKLATTIKNIHRELRISSASIGVEEAWRQHLKDEETLKTYASSMRELAENHWTQNASSDDRINWTINFCEKHFQPEVVERWKQKDLRTIQKMRSDGVDIDEPLEGSVMTFNEKLEVLDVGSSGNFFKHHVRFNMLPIDISPSHDSVFVCDFSSVQIGDKLLVEQRKVETLPRNHFQVVIFCLLLEYLPSSDMRIKCCEKAYEVLNLEGVLIIITPDSSHEMKNAKQIKNWRWTLAKLGFQRIKIEKLKNLTCMSFRKCLQPLITQRWADDHKELYMDFKIEISQDRTQGEYLR